MGTATKVLIQHSNTRATVKVANATVGGADTASINISTDLLFTDGSGTAQTVSSPKVNINKIYYSVPSSGSVTLTRNGVIVATLYGHDTIEGFGLAENNGSNIDISFSAGGTIILELSKVSGFSNVLLDRVV